MKPKWRQHEGGVLIDTAGRAFEMLTLNTRERELLQLPDPPAIPAPAKRPARRVKRRPQR